jgi:hypothetical protein
MKVKFESGEFMIQLKNMLNTISLVIEQRKNKFDRIAKVCFSPSIFMPCEGDITFWTPVGIYFYIEKPVSEYLCQKNKQRG